MRVVLTALGRRAGACTTVSLHVFVVVFFTADRDFEFAFFFLLGALAVVFIHAAACEMTDSDELRLESRAVCSSSVS